MIKIFRSIIILKFKLLTATYLRVNKIKVIAITGSVGKTTTKNFISQLLEDSKTYVPIENLNTEIGLPLAIFKVKLPENTYSFTAWAKVLFLMFGKLLKKASYRRIVLEMGADKPGDISFLTSFAKPDISVITAVSAAHLENFKNIETIAEEKSKILLPLKESSVAVLNYDDEYIRAMATKTKSKVLWIGTNESADISYQRLIFSPTGLSFELKITGQKYKVQTKIIAPQLLISLLSAIGVCLKLGENIDDLVKRISTLEPQKGRMSVLEGINETTIIDDSYNSNPTSALAAIEVLSKYNGRKIAVLGQMNELGDYTRDGHRIVAEEAAKKVDGLYLVGGIGNKYMSESAKEINPDLEINIYDNPYDAGKALKSELKKQDVVLFKGSQNGVFLEEAIKLVLKDKHDSEQLVRQSSFWLRKKENYFKKE